MEFNKLSGAFLLATLIALAVGKIAHGLYVGAGPEDNEKRGYQVEIAEVVSGGAAKVEEVLDIAALMQAASVDKGAKITKKCAACHSFDQGGAHKVGPALWNIVGAGIGHHSDYAYSSAMAEKGGNWDYEALFAFLKKPKNYVPGTKMGFNGLKKPEDIANLVAYLRQQADSPYPLPAK